MFSHIMVGTDDLEASRKFYDATFGALGRKPGMMLDDRVFYLSDSGNFGAVKPINGEPAAAANGGTIGFQVDGPEQGDAWHAAGLANGGTACEDPPGVREGRFGKMYLAYLRDPSGNKLCAMYRIPRDAA